MLKIIFKITHELIQQLEKIKKTHLTTAIKLYLLLSVHLENAEIPTNIVINVIEINAQEEQKG